MSADTLALSLRDNQASESKLSSICTTGFRRTAVEHHRTLHWDSYHSMSHFVFSLKCSAGMKLHKKHLRDWGVDWII